MTEIIKKSAHSVYNEKSSKRGLLYKLLLLLLVEVFLVILAIYFSNPSTLPYTMPFIFLFYYWKVYVGGYYNLKTLEVRNDVLVVSDKKKQNFRALTILKVRNLSADAVFKEVKIHKRGFEKLELDHSSPIINGKKSKIQSMIPEHEKNES